MRASTPQPESLGNLLSGRTFAAMKQGRKPVSVAAYLFLRVWQSTVALERVASELRLDLEHGLETPRRVGLSSQKLATINQAVGRLSR
jgi:hypothetical protein